VFMHHAGFWDGTVFSKPITAIQKREFSRQLELYNIGWIIPHSVSSIEYLNNHPSIESIAKIGRFQVFKVHNDKTFFLEGNGKVVSRRVNRIELDELKGDFVTLKYHYVDGLVSKPSRILKPVIYPGDPEPFIRIVNPPTRLSVSYP